MYVLGIVTEGVAIEITTPSVILKQVFVCHVSLRLMFAVRIVICINFKVCDKLEVYLRTWQYTASGMHTRGKTTHCVVF